jgi:hypothetical protein
LKTLSGVFTYIPHRRTTSVVELEIVHALENQHPLNSSSYTGNTRPDF